jgi:hypothetical protein
LTVQKRDVKILLVLLGVLFLAASYWFVYNPLSQQADSLQAQTQDLKPRLNTLRGYYHDLDTYQNAITQTKNTVEKERSRYPDDVRPENMIMYADQLRNNFGIDIQELSFEDPVPCLEFKGFQEGGNKNDPLNLTAYQRSMTVKCGVGYAELKKLIDFVYQTDHRTSVDTVNVSFDSKTGKLTGDVMLNQYFIAGTGNAYVPAQVPDVEKGREDLFGTVSAPEQPEG